MTVERGIEIANLIYEDNSVGCCLHIVLEDGNLERGHVQFCLDEAKKIRHGYCVELAEGLLTMSPLDRVAVFRANHESDCCSDEDVIPED